MYLRKIFFYGLLIGIVSVPVISKAQKSDLNGTKPNILLINIDDLGWKGLGYMGSKFYETPNIDRLSSQGMIFSRAYAAAANCAPSRAALFSGMYGPRTGVYTVGSSDRGQSIHRKLIPTPNTEYLADSVRTVAEVLQQHGYTTIHVGKWHIGKDPTRQGFDINIAGAEYGHPASYFSPYHNRVLKDGPKGEYLTDRITGDAIDSLKRITDNNKPFFMNFATYAIHGPIQPKPELKKKYENKAGFNGQDNPGYAALTETMDHNVGRLINYLKQSGKFEHTFIVFTSDNGGVYRFTKQWPLRAGKGSYYEGGIRVPMFVVWPGNVSPGTTTSQAVSNIDFYPTFLAVAGIEKPAGKILDGKSLLPVLQGKKGTGRPLFWHFPIYLQNGNKETGDRYFRTRPGSVVESGGWKLHEYFEDGHLELYNLGAEIGEKKNLKSMYPQKTRELHSMLEQWRAQTDAPVPVSLNPDYKGK